MKPFDYAIAGDLPGALRAAGDGWVPKAGGIDLVDRLKSRIEPAERVVSIGGVEVLRGVALEGGALTLGPLATLAEVAGHPGIGAGFPALAHAAGEAATPQVRAVATVGGNLLQRPRCWYLRRQEFRCLKKGGPICYAAFGEHDYHAIFGGGPCHIVHPSSIAPALVAADAELTLARAGGERKVVAERFFVLPKRRMDGESVIEEGELLTRIRVPKLPTRSAWVEARRRDSFDWPMAGCAAVLLDARWRVVLGGVAPVPWRAKAAEAALAGEADIDAALADKAAEAAVSDADPMRDNAWRVPIARAVVRRALLAAAGKELEP